MRKRMLSILCVLALCLGLLPVTALADGPDSSITNIPAGLEIEGTVVTDYEGTATVVAIPEGVTEIDDRAFLSSTVQEVTLPDTLKAIGEYAFAQSALTSITIPESVTTIEAFAFTKTKSLIDATILGNPTLGNNAFSESGIKSIEMDQVTAISDQCFASSSLSSISMGSVKSIEQGAFQFTNLTEFTVPDTVESIGPYFLDNIDDLDKLTVSLATLQKPGISSNAFANISSTCEVVLTDVDQDVILLEEGLTVNGQTYGFGRRFHIATVQATAGTITNQTGGDVSVVVGGETITVATGNAKPVGSTASSDAYLENLTVTADSSVLILDPSFANPTIEYTSSVGNETASVGVMAQPSNSAAAVAINSQTADAANSYTVNVALSEGENSISIVVTAPDGTTQKTYTVTITRNEAVPKHITISTADELMDFASKINDGTYVVDTTVDMLVELTADIDMSGYNWVPIGISVTQYFAGTFDGNDHTISNLKMSNDKAYGSYLGLFGVTEGDILDVNVTGEFYDLSSGTPRYYFGPVVGFTNGNVIGCTTNFTVQGEGGELRGYPVGGVVGYIYGPDEMPLKLENCISYTNISGTLTGPTYMGGVSGLSVNTEIINCRNEGTISISGVSGYYTYIGGIVGQTQTGTVVDHCVNNGDITQAGTGGTVSIGGICGRASTFTKITYCTNNGDLDTNANDAGGILGAAYYGGAVEDCVIMGCLNTGAVSSSNSGAGVAGIGNAFGVDGEVDITANISLGELSATEQNATVHPVTTDVSTPDSATFSDNYYDESIKSQGTIPDAVITGSTGKPLTELETETFIQQVNSEGGNFRLDEDGHIEVIPLSYTLTVVGSYADISGAGEHEEGEQVTIDAGSRPGYSFEGWTATSGTIADPTASRTTFTMPDEAATVTASWAAIPDDPDPSYSIKMDIGDHGSVHTSHRTAEKGETVTLTVTPDDGYVLSDLTVTDSSGKTIKLTSKGSDRYTFEMPARAVTVTAEFVREGIQKLPFTDVPNNAWYYDGVAYVYEHGLMAGTSAATFGPDVTTSRAMIATILWRLAGSPVVNYAMDYTDVAQDQWYSEAVRWATSEGVVTGYGNGLFGTDDPITREQLATMLWRYAQTEDYDLSIGEDTNILSYSDVLDLSQWAMPAMQWACGAGIISGTGDGSALSPQGRATRAQAAVMLTRFCEEYVTW